MTNKKKLYKLLNSEFSVIEYTDKEGRILRALASDDAFYSDTMTGKQKYDLYYPYVRLYDMPNIIKPDIKNTLVLGAGCFTYPKYYISRYNDKYIDCVEVDSEIIDVAHKYFYLDDLYKDYDPTRERLRVFVEDAYDYISNCSQKYDYIFLDVYKNNEPVDKFLDLNFLEMISKCLNLSSVFSTNYMINPGKEEKFNDYILKLKKYFKYLYLLTLDDKKVFDGKNGNVYVMCSNTPLSIPIYEKIMMLNPTQ